MKKADKVRVSITSGDLYLRIRIFAGKRRPTNQIQIKAFESRHLKPAKELNTILKLGIQRLQDSRPEVDLF